ncbi:MAG: DUF167 domain-containing protein [Actinomycetota bacterium]
MGGGKEFEARQAKSERAATGRRVIRAESLESPAGATASGALLRLRVVPGAGATAVAGRYGAAVRIRVAAPAREGRANREVLRFLAKTLSVRPGELSLAAGERSRDKVVSVTGLEPEEVISRLLGVARGQ